jgi:putative Mg2+ transporter-C (MgtC) family protein
MFSAILADISGNWENILKLVLASICGGLIGFERSLRHKDAGIRTHIILCMGTALFVIVSRYGFTGSFGNANSDVTRIAANIVTGIGFLGAGVIFLRGGSIKGLTTAAGIWTAAGIGMAVGSGMYTIGIISTLFIVGIQFLFHKVSPGTENMQLNELVFTYPEGSSILDDIKARLKQHHIHIQGVKISRNPDDTVTATISIWVGKNESLSDFLDIAAKLPELKDYSISN